MYSSISLKFEGADLYATSPPHSIEGLSKVNIFVGPNNSGKSRFLRLLFDNDNLQFQVSNPDFNELSKIANDLAAEIKRYYTENGIISITGIDLDLISKVEYLNKGADPKKRLREFLKSLDSPSKVSFDNGSSSRADHLRNYFRHVQNTFMARLGKARDLSLNDIIATSLYVPVLRGLRGVNYDKTLRLVMRDSYQIRTVEDYFSVDQKYQTRVFTGLSLYNDIRALLLGGSKEREKIRRFQEFIGTTFFDGAEFTIIPHVDDDVVHVKIGDEDDYPIHQLGEGIQSLIILTYPLFMNMGKRINVFYEEPDAFLHPGFQRVFLETLYKPDFDNFQFFFTTHSNHFLDMTMDYGRISIYGFRKKDKQFNIDLLDGPDKSVLEDLGVKESSVFLSNCTIWVEGITDRIYLRKYLELYMREPKVALFHEDIHYSFVEYAGSNITHWSFLENSSEHKNMDVERLCGRLFLITDRDSDQPKKDGEPTKKQLRRGQLEAKLGKRYYCLKAREIENILPPSAIVAAITKMENRDVSSVDFLPLEEAKYKDVYLGGFIDAKIGGLSKQYGSSYGTIANKTSFATAAVNSLTSFKDLTDEAKRLTQLVHQFIADSNR